ncbi:MAG: oligosaccharide flippase family protein [Actinomycetota bacterium]
MPPEVVPGVVEHPELDTGPTAHPELDSREVSRLAMRGVGVLMLRSLAQRGLQMAGNILLARWLAPTTFGLYAVISFLVGIAGFLSDLGVGASLVQRRERLTDSDLKAAFTLSLGLNAIAVAALWAISPLLVRIYDAPEAIMTIRALALTIFLGTFAQIPAVVLERALQFKALAVAELSGQVAYLSVALTMAFPYWRQPGLAEERAASAVWIFVYATLASRAVHAIIVNLRSPWRPGLSTEPERMRRLLAFGLPFQLNGLINALKDNFIPIFIALVVGARATGYVVWAVGLVTNALVLMPIVSKVAFPAYSRLQHDMKALKVAIETSIRLVAMTVIPAALFLAAFARQIVEHVYVPKWEPALPTVYLLLIPMIHASYSTVCVSALYGVGRAKTVLRLTLVWAIAGWALGIPLTLAVGMHGFAIAMSIVSWLSFMSVRAINKVVKISFIPDLLRITFIAAVPASVCAIASAAFVHDAWQLLALAIAGGIAYLSGLWLSGDLKMVLKLVQHSRKPHPQPIVATQVVTENA